MFTTAVDTASAHCSPFFLVLLFIITIQLFCWLSPPLGNKITDAGVLLYTPRQHQDVVPRRKQHSPFSPSLLFNRKKKDVNQAKETDRWCFHTESILFAYCQTPPSAHFTSVESSSRESCRTATFIHIRSARAPWLLTVQCFSTVNVLFDWT